MAEPFSLILLVALAAFLVGLSKGGLPAVATLGVPILALVISPVARPEAPAPHAAGGASSGPE